MTIFILIISVLIFIAVDLVIRKIIRQREETKQREERQKALNLAMKLDYTQEAKSLQRVEVDDPKARILAVDDEPVVLDSFRKILVLAGYSVDTVESGPEALGLIQKNDYEFVFTDLKMPEVDGIDVVKAVRHFRPDIDVIVITGYATIETAVEAMKYGALDYVQKPFTEDELVELVNMSLIRRQDRLEKQLKPIAKVITLAPQEACTQNEILIPGGIFIDSGHSWVALQVSGEVRIGIDDFVRKMIGRIDKIIFPEMDAVLKRSDIIFRVKQGERTISVRSPLTGQITVLNGRLNENPRLLADSTYEEGWICSMMPSDFMAELKSMKMGQDAAEWCQKEISRLVGMIRQFDAKEKKSEFEQGELRTGQLESMSEEAWETFADTFLHTKLNE